ncbi:hypothetical protein J7K74_01600 [Candidatus Woesearchaeota archaeon]|nr:hypothetical protein [Candidatus Woesearchaeota archaeon]
MSLLELRKVFEKRKYNLIKLLENPKDLSPEKQHQIYGAILEIDNFLRAIDHFREKEMNRK